MKKRSAGRRRTDPQRFEWVDGVDLKARVGVAKCPSIRCSADIARSFQHLAELDREVMVAGALDCKCRLVAWSVVAIGSDSRMFVRVGDVFGVAVRHNAHALFLVHNHPSGSVKISREDVDLTLDVAEAGLLLGYPLFDHVVVAGGEHRTVLNNRLLRARKARFDVAPARVRQASDTGYLYAQWTCVDCHAPNLAIAPGTARSRNASPLCGLAKCKGCGKTTWLDSKRR